MLGVICVCTRSYIMIFGVIEVLLSVNQRALGPGSSCKPITIYGTYVRICVCTPQTLKIYLDEGTGLVSVRIFVNKMNTYRLKR